MNATLAPKALIAEDELLLAASLQSQLTSLWPELETRQVSDGLQAVDQALLWLPDVLFFDVRMPGQSGLDAAHEIAERWPPGQRLPLLAFVTAFNEFAVQAFEHAAVDYIVKPVQTDRLQQTVARIQSAVAMRSESSVMPQSQKHAAAESNHTASDPDSATLQALYQLLKFRPDLKPSHSRLQRIQASVGQQIVVLPLAEVLCFVAADKYVRVLTDAETPARELLIRTPIKDLLAQLDPDEFWQIHRGTLIRVCAIASVHRDELGKLSLQIRGCTEKFAVSRVYAHLFKAM